MAIESRETNTMPQTQLPPTASQNPSPPSSTKRGGTLIAHDILTLEQHEAAVCNPELEHPDEGCPHCAGGLHVHDRRSRCIGGLRGKRTQILIFECPTCEVVWRVLPAFIPPRRWWAWEPIVEALEGETNTHRVPDRTRRRWQARLLVTCVGLIMVLAQMASAVLRELARLGPEATLGEVVEAFGGVARLPALALSLDDRDEIQRRVRVM